MGRRGPVQAACTARELRELLGRTSNIRGARSEGSTAFVLDGMVVFEFIFCGGGVGMGWDGVQGWRGWR